MEKKQNWRHILGKAMIIGGTMTVPGASGGTMAMILGIYEDLIAAVGNLPGLLADGIFSKGRPPAKGKRHAMNPKDSAGPQNAARQQTLSGCLRFLALFCLGALAGMALLARGVLALLEQTADGRSNPHPADYPESGDQCGQIHKRRLCLSLYKV